MGMVSAEDLRVSAGREEGLNGKESGVTEDNGKLLPDSKIESIRRIYILKLKKIVGVNIGRKSKL